MNLFSNDHWVKNADANVDPLSHIRANGISNLVTMCSSKNSITTLAVQFLNVLAYVHRV